MPAFDRRLLVSIGLLLTLATSAGANPLLQFTFPGDPASLAPTTTDANVVAGPIGLGNVTQWSGVTGLFVLNLPDGTQAESTAIANNVYFQFTAAPASGMELNLTSLLVSAANGFPSSITVRSSVDGFASNVFSAAVGVNYPSFANFTIDLSGANFQAVTSAITFRVYAWDNLPVGAAALGFNNVTLNGSVAAAPVPEPGSFATGALGLASLAYLANIRQPKNTKRTQR